MRIIRYIRYKMMSISVEKQQKFYSSYAESEIQQYQLQQFNLLWQEMAHNVPFYANLIKQGVLPSKIESFADFSKLPIVDRETIAKGVDAFCDGSKPPDSFSSTGGSTGNPLKFPKWASEVTFCEPSIWYVRNFYHVSRFDKMFRVWGHSHILGKGLQRIKNKLLFDIGLPLVGFKRFSAYDLSEAKLQQAGDEILKFKPAYIIGYSKALFMLAKANEYRKNEFHALNLKVILGAAEGFDSEVDKVLVSEVFGCPVGLQYASMEANYIAQTHPDGNYKVLWKNNLIECVDDEGNPAPTGRILVTSLYPRAFPLIRYEMGDLIANCKKDEYSVFEFECVKGRDNDFLMLDNTTPIHSEGITHAIKLSSKVTAYQIRYTKEGVYTICLTSNETLEQSEFLEIKQRLAQVDTRLASLEVVQEERLKQTIAGKTKWLIEE